MNHGVGRGLGGHEVAAKKAKIGIGVGFFKFADKFGGMKVAGSLAGYDEIFHLRFCLKKDCIRARDCVSHTPRTTWQRG